MCEINNRTSFDRNIKPSQILPIWAGDRNQPISQITTMISSDTPVTRVKAKQDVGSIIYQMSLFTLLETRQKLRKMAENGEIEITTGELNRRLSFSLQKLATALEQQMVAADLWQTENRCPQCELRLMPLLESCICGCKNINGDRLGANPKRLEAIDLSFLIAENCTE